MANNEKSRDSLGEDSVEKAGAAMAGLQESGAQVAANVKEVAEHFSKAILKSSKGQPLTTLGIAAAMGSCSAPFGNRKCFDSPTFGRKPTADFGTKGADRRFDAH